MKLFRISMWVLIAVIAGAIAYTALNFSQKPTSHGVAQVGGPFELVDQENNKITQQDLIGKPHVVFFGFTHCPDICPTTLFEAASWMQELGADADKLGFYFFTVDPERDTPEILKDYVGSFDERITAVTGPQDEVAETIKKYRIYAKKVVLDDDDYTMDHSASVMLFKADGSYKGSISYGENKDNAVEKLKNLLKNS